MGFQLWERSLSGHKSTHLHTHDTMSEAEVKNNVEGEATAEELKATKRPAEDTESDPKKQKTSNGDTHEEEDLEGEEEGEDEGEDEEDLGEEDEEDLDGEGEEDEGGEEGEEDEE